MTVVSLAVMPVSLSAVNAQAMGLAEAYNSQTEIDFRQGLQIRLAWAGDYVGPFDGIVGPRTLRAIRDFQARHGMDPNGVITDEMLTRLVGLSDSIQNGLGVAFAEDEKSGSRMLIPFNRVVDSGRTDVGNLWRSEDGRLEVETVRVAGSGQTLKGLYDVLLTETDTRSVTGSEFGGEWFKVFGKDAGREYLMRFEVGKTDATDLRGFSVSYDPAIEDEVEPFLSVASELFEPFASDPSQPLLVSRDDRPFTTMMRNQRAGSHERDGRFALAHADPSQPNMFAMPPEPSDVDAMELDPSDVAFDMAGSGFAVSKDGWVLTNAHVVNACNAVFVSGYGRAVDRIVDADNDLALVKVEGRFEEPLKISTGKPRLGEDILALGFPLRSILADSLNVTRGNVSSLLGLMNDPRYMQISAPVQPGNSGGPLVDLSGRVVGVVTAKLNAVAIADATGDIPQSINFAIQPNAVSTFLDASDIEYVTADANGGLQSVPDAVESVKSSIVPVLCLDE
ncbi:serine protease [Fulvimarina sp. 2208YS6-2-32]|uniref:Serine protease n=1 Tax=Fulvimarina uroteuthidis TaxID=3098149 RepID=A0ABU5I5N0_9HYPH|nr:serine protease [Fulvimarina sp. 2208YS6-2-32]MDY8110425.1 serine protease [Fulvimarina sp. 2208YS6-2-32]